MAHDANLSPKQRSELEELLRQERARLTTRHAAELTSATRRDPEVDDEGDLAAEITEESTNLRLADNDLRTLREIDAALQRVNDGTYGLDEDTQEPIGYPRLKAIPWARHAVANEERRERG
ncbi:MAG: TraR/DksA family transcriptional regulator [Polyangiales bacterium]